MSPDSPVARRQVEITYCDGLHLRPAMLFVKLASRFQSEISVSYNGKKSDGKSILNLTTLVAECGARLDLEARGQDAEWALEALVQLVASDFREPAEPPHKDPAL